DVRRRRVRERQAHVVVVAEVAPRIVRALAIRRARALEILERPAPAPGGPQEQRVPHRPPSAGSSAGEVGEYEGLPDHMSSTPPNDITGAAMMRPVPIAS